MPGRCGQQLTWTGTREDNPPRYCMRWPRRGRTRCRGFAHGGGTPTGMANTSYKPGIYSKALPGVIRDDYEKLLRDPALLSMRDEIALTRARLIQMMGVVDGQVGGRCVKALAGFFEAWDRWGRARSKDVAAVKAATVVLEEAVEALRAAFEPERRQQDALRDIRADTGLLEKLERSENARVKDLYDMISGERAFALKQAETAVFLEAITLHVPERATQDAIRRHVATKFAELTHRRDAPALVAAGGPEPGTEDSGADE